MFLCVAGVLAPDCKFKCTQRLPHEFRYFFVDALGWSRRSAAVRMAADLIMFSIDVSSFVFIHAHYGRLSLR